jgi:putative membrane protein
MMYALSSREVRVIKIVKFILVVVFLIIGAAFAIINDQSVELDLYFMVTSLPLSLILLLATGVGILMGAVVSAFYFMRLRRENAVLRRQSRLVEQEVKNLRSLPINGH